MLAIGAVAAAVVLIEVGGVLSGLGKSTADLTGSGTGKLDYLNNTGITGTLIVIAVCVKPRKKQLGKPCVVRPCRVCSPSDQF